MPGRLVEKAVERNPFVNPNRRHDLLEPGGLIVDCDRGPIACDLIGRWTLLRKGSNIHKS